MLKHLQLKVAEQTMFLDVFMTAELLSGVQDLSP